MAKRKPINATRVRIGQNLNVWLPDGLMAAFEFLRQRHKRTLKAECEVMMEQYCEANKKLLESEGLWPPKSDDGGE